LTITPFLERRHKGSVPEVVADGITGFVRETHEELVEAVGRPEEIDRRACRQRVEECPSAEAMTANYERFSRAEVALHRRPHVASAMRKVAAAGV
jgi:hypothetical protein